MQLWIWVMANAETGHCEVWRLVVEMEVDSMDRRQVYSSWRVVEMTLDTVVRKVNSSWWVGEIKVDL